MSKSATTMATVTVRSQDAIVEEVEVPALRRRPTSRVKQPNRAPTVGVQKNPTK